MKVSSTRVDEGKKGLTSLLSRDKDARREPRQLGEGRIENSLLLLLYAPPDLSYNYYY